MSLLYITYDRKCNPVFNIQSTYLKPTILKIYKKKSTQYKCAKFLKGFNKYYVKKLNTQTKVTNFDHVIMFWIAKEIIYSGIKILQIPFNVLIEVTKEVTTIFWKCYFKLSYCHSQCPPLEVINGILKVCQNLYRYIYLLLYILKSKLIQESWCHGLVTTYKNTCLWGKRQSRTRRVSLYPKYITDILYIVVKLMQLFVAELCKVEIWIYSATVSFLTSTLEPCHACLLVYTFSYIEQAYSYIGTYTCTLYWRCVRLHYHMLWQFIPVSLSWPRYVLLLIACFAFCITHFPFLLLLYSLC